MVILRHTTPFHSSIVLPCSVPKTNSPPKSCRSGEPDPRDSILRRSPPSRQINGYTQAKDFRGGIHTIIRTTGDSVGHPRAAVSVQYRPAFVDLQTILMEDVRPSFAEPIFLESPDAVSVDP